MLSSPRQSDGGRRKPGRGFLALLSPALAGLAIFLALVQAWGTHDLLIDAMGLTPGGNRLTKDALGYYELAARPGPFYRPSVREPLFPALLRFVLPARGAARPPSVEGVPPGHLAVRRFTGWMGLATLAAIAVVAWRQAGHWAGAVAAWIYAIAALPAHYAVSGLRESTTGFLVVSLVGALVTDPRTRVGVWTRTAAIVGLSAALPLLRLEFLGVIPLLLLGNVLWRWAGSRASAENVTTRGNAGRWHRPMLEAAAGIAAGWIVVAPFLVACQREYGEAFHVTRVHATYWRNHEFAGQPGYRTRDEVMADPYAGPPVTPVGYIFGMHSLPGVFGRYVRGYWITFAHTVPILFRRLAVGANPTDSLPNPLVWLWLLGLFWSLVHWRQHAFVPWAALAAQLPYAFIVPLNTVLAGRTAAGVELRFSLPVAPFIAVLVGIGVVEAIRQIWRWRGKMVGATGLEPVTSRV